MRNRARATAVALVVLASMAAPAEGRGRASVAALQVALRAEGVYAGSIDGVMGPGTSRAVARLQRARSIAVDGIAGRATRRALGRRGRPVVGSRAIRAGARGWDVAALQFSLAAHGFASGAVDGGFGARSEAALERFQRWAGLRADGIAGASTRRALRRAPPRSPLRFLAPVGGRIGDGFGPRGVGMHTGLDYPAPTGTPVGAAGRGCVVIAAYDAGGYGNVVVIAHRLGVTAWYAHLASMAVVPGRCLVAGTPVGTVGSTGHSSGPHLHFEIRVRGATVDPLTGL